MGYAQCSAPIFPDSCVACIRTNQLKYIYTDVRTDVRYSILEEYPITRDSCNEKKKKTISFWLFWNVAQDSMMTTPSLPILLATQLNPSRFRRPSRYFSNFSLKYRHDLATPAVTIPFNVCWTLGHLMVFRMASLSSLFNAC